MRFLYTIFRILTNIKKTKGKGIKESQKKVGNWDTELPIFTKKMEKYKRTLKFTKSPQTMIKIFDSIKEAFGTILEYKPCNMNIKFDSCLIDSVNELDKIDKIRDIYLKEFLNKQINIELEKEKEVNQIFLKESLIKKALTQALKAIEYIPEDVEMRLRIIEIEDKLMDLYK